jgi:hypothetical protein
MMMALIVSGIVLLGVFALSSIQRTTASMHHRAVRTQHALEGAMWTIGRDLRMAGLGITRNCTELRVYSQALNQMVNPGAADGGNLLSDGFEDPITGEPYWVLRDGVQAHWRSSTNNLPLVNLTSIQGGASIATSARPESPADSFDVILGERNYTSATGVFSLSVAPPLTSSATAFIEVTVGAGAGLSSGNAAQLNQVRQLFPPGSFLLLARPNNGALPSYMPESRGQCALLQVTDDVIAGAGALAFRIPIGSQSGFNANLNMLLGDGRPDKAAGTDWDPGLGGAGTDAAPGSIVVPLGGLRWSRYEIDYSRASQPYLIRSEFISWVTGDPQVAGDMAYPQCATGTQCRLPQLHLPDPATPLTQVRVAIGPMIEDMQVAVGCDGWVGGTIAPDVGFGEVGFEPAGPPNQTVDEWTTNKRRDEWLGNSVQEEIAPDCVFYGTGEQRAAAWATTGPVSETGIGPGFRMSPQTVRVTLLAKPESIAADNSPSASPDPFYNRLFQIEDRPETAPIAGIREYQTLTETFTPRNLRWRNPQM